MAEKAKKAEALKLFEVMKAQFEQNESALRHQLREKDDEIERLRLSGAPPIRDDAEEDRNEQDAQAANARAEQAEQELNDFKVSIDVVKLVLALCWIVKNRGQNFPGPRISFFNDGSCM